MDNISDVMNSIGYKKTEAIKPETMQERIERMNKETVEKCELSNSEVGDLDKQDGYDCKLCKNRGSFFVPEMGTGGFYHEAYRRCKCMKIRSMIAKMERSGLKNLIKDYTFDKYEETEQWQKQLKEKAMAFAKDESNTWFFIGGMTGVGKTHLCTAIAAHYLRNNKAVKYMIWRDDITAIKSLVTDNERYSKAIDELKTTEVLYIDDLFKMGSDENGMMQRPTTADINIAFEILNYRYNNKDLITIISSERTLHDLIDIDGALGGRISEMTVKAGYYIGVKYDPQKNYRTKGIVEI